MLDKLGWQVGRLPAGSDGERHRANQARLVDQADMELAGTFVFADRISGQDCREIRLRIVEHQRNGGQAVQ
jgi:hypothetical protein